MTVLAECVRAPRPDSVPAVEAALGTELKQGNATREFAEPLLDALTLAYRETVGSGDGDQAQRLNTG